MARGAQAGKALTFRHSTPLTYGINTAALLAAVLCAFPLAAQRASQGQVALTATSRSVQVGDSAVSENVVAARYDFTTARIRVRLDGSVLRFAAPADTISGHLPVGIRLDFARRPGDTLSAFVRSSSQPLDLTVRLRPPLAGLFVDDRVDDLRVVLVTEDNA